MKSDIDFATVGDIAKAVSDLKAHIDSKFAAQPPITPPPTQSPYVPQGYTLTFSDEFDGTTEFKAPALDKSKWYTRYMFRGLVQGDFLNDELQHYTDNNVHQLSNSVLSLVARPAVFPGDDYHKYESGMIQSKFTQKYGYFEARCKMPKFKGAWPAFWLTEDNGSWPPEIDIFEFVNNTAPGDNKNTIHTGVIDHGQQGQVVDYADVNFNTQWNFWQSPFDFTNEWHVFGCLWDESSYSMFVDGQRIVRRLTKWVHDDGTPAGPAHVLFDLAVGGQWAGRNGIDVIAPGDAFQIDYVRVYQK
jgi:beta-glucanase (GH16 family)